MRQRYLHTLSTTNLANLSLFSLRSLCHSSLDFLSPSVSCRSSSSSPSSKHSWTDQISSTAIRDNIWKLSSSFVTTCSQASITAQCRKTLSLLSQYPLRLLSSSSNHHHTLATPPPSSWNSLLQHDAVGVSSCHYPLDLHPSHHYAATQTPIPLVADKVSLPDAAATVDLLSLLPPHARQLYSDPSNFFSPHYSSSRSFTSSATEARHFCSRGEYILLLRRLYQKGMIGFTHHPKVVNGLFGVEKDESSIRLIIDARPANERFVDPPHVELPTPSTLAALHVPPSASLFVAKIDLSNFYHQLRLPDAWTPYFCLPSINSEEARSIGMPSNFFCSHTSFIYPMCLTLPMGFSHAVALAQLVHEHVLYSCGALAKSDNILNLSAPLLDHPLHLLYIDDNVLLDTDHQRLSSVYHRVLSAYSRAGLAINPKKILPPTDKPVEVLGILVNGAHCTLSVSPQRIIDLLRSTYSALVTSRLTGSQMRHLIGSWTWALLLRRPSLSALRHAYHFIEVAASNHRRRFSLWKSVARELIVLCGLVPFLSVSLRQPIINTVVATDACCSGGAVVVSPPSSSSYLSRMLWPLTIGKPDECVPTILTSSPPIIVDSSNNPSNSDLGIRQPSRCSSSVPNRRMRPGILRRLPPHHKWKTVISTPWHHDEHINALELRAVLLAMRWLSRRSSHNSRIIILIDSAVSFFSLRKGRTSSNNICYPLRKIAALSLACSITLLPVWIPSLSNPADAPSRKWVH